MYQRGGSPYPIIINHNITPMETTKRRKQVTLRITEELRERLNQEARKEHRSVNNLVEGILLDAMYYEPNEETIEAIEEARAGRYAGTIDLSSREAFIRSCSE